MTVTPMERPDDVQDFYFNGITVRAVLINHEPWFVANNVATALGYRDAYNMTRRLDDDEKGTHSVSTPGGTQTVAVISESGLYAAILGSQVEGAKAFKKWVTSEVLPAIRKTGKFEAPKSLTERSLELIQDLTAELEAARPKVERHDRIIEPGHTFLFREMCRHLRERYPVNEADVKKLMRRKGLMTSIRAQATSDAISRGFAVTRAVGKFGGKEREQTRWTPKALDWLYEQYAPLEEAA